MLISIQTGHMVVRTRSHWYEMSCMNGHLYLTISMSLSIHSLCSVERGSVSPRLSSATSDAGSDGTEYDLEMNRAEWICISTNPCSRKLVDLCVRFWRDSMYGVQCTVMVRCHDGLNGSPATGKGHSRAALGAVRVCVRDDSFSLWQPRICRYMYGVRSRVSDMVTVKGGVVSFSLLAVFEIHTR